MAELGTIITVIGLASGAWTAAQKAQEFIEDIYDAPEEVAGLAIDLAALTAVLAELQEFLNRNRHLDANKTAYLHALAKPLSSCMAESEDIFKTIEPYVKAFDGGEKAFKWRVKWVYHKDEVLEHHKTLVHYRDTLHLTVSVASLSYTNQNLADLSGRVDQLIQQVGQQQTTRDTSISRTPSIFRAKHDLVIQEFLTYTGTVIGQPPPKPQDSGTSTLHPYPQQVPPPPPPTTVSTPGGSTSHVHTLPIAQPPPNLQHPSPRRGSSPGSSPREQRLPIRPSPIPSPQLQPNPSYRRPSQPSSPQPQQSTFPAGLPRSSSPQPMRTSSPQPQSYSSPRIPPATPSTVPRPLSDRLVVALWRFSSPLPHLLSLHPGDLLTIKAPTSNLPITAALPPEHQSQTWLYGHRLPHSNLLQDLREGYFPATHVAPATHFEAQAAHDFFTTDKECLKFIRGEKVTVTYCTDSVWDWWVGWTVDGKRGRFPGALLRRAEGGGSSGGGYGGHPHGATDRRQTSGGSRSRSRSGSRAREGRWTEEESVVDDAADPAGGSSEGSFLAVPVHPRRRAMSAGR